MPDHFRLDGEVIGFDAGEPYFNSGMILIDMARWRERNCEQRVLDVLARWGHELPWMDQDALNIALRGEVRFLDLVWNWQPRCADVPAAFLGLDEASSRSRPHGTQSCALHDLLQAVERCISCPLQHLVFSLPPAPPASPPNICRPLAPPDAALHKG